MERGTVLAVTFSDLLFRFRQFLIAIIGVTLVLALALLLSGLASGFSTEVSQTVGGFGADSWVLSKAAGGRITAFVAFPESGALAIAGAPGVHDASPVLLVPLQVAHDSATQLTVNLVGVVPGKLGDPAATEGHDLNGPNQVVVDDQLAVAIGSNLVLGGHDLRVVGTVMDRTLLGGTPMIYASLKSAQAIVVHGQPLITAVVSRGSPATLPPAFIKYTPAQVTATTLSQMQSAVSSIENVRWLMWVLAAIIVGALVYVAALERQRDFAVLKALGASSWALFGSLILEAVLVTLVATVLAELIANALTPFLFSQPVDIRLSAYATLPIIAIVVGALASLTALRRVVTADPAAAFG
jgi:putative ABC transport system permease protein